MPGTLKVNKLETNSISLDDIQDLKAIINDLQSNIQKFNNIIGNYDGNLEVLEGNVESIEAALLADDDVTFPV